jgi:hypothetical protein
MSRSTLQRFAGLFVVAAALGSVAACEDRPNVTGALEGLVGTTVRVDVTDEFVARLRTTPTGSTSLEDTDFAANAYDAVVTLALAAEAAGTDGFEIARRISDITREGTRCADFASCRTLLASGIDPDYDGPSGANPLNDLGEPDEAVYEVRTMGANDRIDPEQSSFVATATPAEMRLTPPTTEGSRAGDGVLHLGLLVPLTGNATIYGPAIRAGFELAVADINAAGGVLGKTIEVSVADSGDITTDLPTRSALELIGLGVDAIVGPATSSVALEIIDTVTAAGVVLFSPSNTAATLTVVPDRGLYFRNVPSDLLQADALAQAIADRGNATVYLLVIDDPYGLGIAAQLAASLARLGVEVVGSVSYDPLTADFFALARAARATDPDAIVLSSFNESSRLLRALVAAGIGPRQKHVFGTDGAVSNAIGENFDAGR